jgi:hypothetical protein
MPIPAELEQRLMASIEATMEELRLSDKERVRRRNDVRQWLDELREGDLFQRWLDPSYYGSKKIFEDDASKRAEKLLRNHLTAEQREDLDKKGYFQIIVDKRHFRIKRGTSHNVVEVNKNGRKIRTFCAHPDGVPESDVMLSQKLALEIQPSAFFSVANASNRRDDRHTKKLIAGIVPILIEAREQFRVERRIEFRRQLQEALHRGLEAAGY